MTVVDPWREKVTAFAVARRGAEWLMIRHERLGVTSWELPGGHVDPGETLEQAAARETAEETGVVVEVGALLATCVHEWSERRVRTHVSYFAASAAPGSEPRAPAEEPAVHEAAWVVPADLDAVSPFVPPLLEQAGSGRGDGPLFYRMTHRVNADGLWVPVLSPPPPAATR